MTIPHKTDLMTIQLDSDGKVTFEKFPHPVLEGAAGVKNIIEHKLNGETEGRFEVKYRALADKILLIGYARIKTGTVYGINFISPMWRALSNERAEEIYATVISNVVRDYARAYGSDYPVPALDRKAFVDSMATKVGITTGRYSYDEAQVLAQAFRVSGLNSSVFFDETVDGDSPNVEATPVVDETAKPDDEWIGSFYMGKQMRKLLKVCKATRDAGKILVVGVLGPSGYGKTAMTKAFAEHLGMEYECVDIGQLTDVKELFGTLEASDGSTMFKKSRASKLLPEGNLVLVLDEINRVEAWLLNGLYPILDYRRKTTVSHEDVVVGPGTIIFLTMNRGNAKYVGTFGFDEALSNRVDAWLIVEEPETEDVEIDIVRRQYPEVKEAKLKLIVRAVRKLRETVKQRQYDVDVSTRLALGIAQLHSYGMTIGDAFAFRLLNRSNDTELKSLWDVVKGMVGNA